MPRVVLNYPEFGGMYGIKRYALELHKALVAQGCATRLRASRAREWSVAGRKVGGIVTRRLRNHWPVVGGDLLHTADYLSNPTLRRADVVTVHDVIPLQYPHLARLSDAERAMQERAVRRALKGFVITDAEVVRRHLVEAYGAREERTRSIHLGVDRDAFHPAPGGPAKALMKPGMLNVVVAMNADPRKRVDHVLAAARALPFVRVLHAGARNASPELEGVVAQMMQDAAALEAEGRYQNLGAVSGEMLRGLFSDADVVVHPSLAEGFGFPPLEALACGARVLASDIPPQREVLGNAVRFFAPDVPSLRKALEDVWQDGKLREGAFPAREARLAHAAAFTWERTARETIDVYDRVKP